MPLPELSLGLVVRYEYLWNRLAEDGAETADKERPVCVAFTFTDPEHGPSVMLLPISHSPPTGDEIGIEIPQAVKNHLGLDYDRSWVFVSECNIDSWPSPDLRQIPFQPGKFAYGHIPPRLFKTIRDTFVTEYQAKRVRRVRRF
jgi:hypothetical protein